MGAELVAHGHQREHVRSCDCRKTSWFRCAAVPRGLYADHRFLFRSGHGDSHGHDNADADPDIASDCHTFGHAHPAAVAHGHEFANSHGHGSAHCHGDTFIYACGDRYTDGHADRDADIAAESYPHRSGNSHSDGATERYTNSNTHRDHQRDSDLDFYDDPFALSDRYTHMDTIRGYEHTNTHTHGNVDHGDYGHVPTHTYADTNGNAHSTRSGHLLSVYDSDSCMWSGIGRKLPFGEYRRAVCCLHWRELRHLYTENWNSDPNTDGALWKLQDRTWGRL
jgi:hypothetical protein